MRVQHNPTRRTEGKTGARGILFLGCRWETWKRAWFACGSFGHSLPRFVGTLGHRDNRRCISYFAFNAITPTSVSRMEQLTGPLNS